MFNKMKHMKNEKGLTLIELLAVIVILAIIAAIAIPAIGNIIENSRYNSAKSDALNVLSAGQLYYTENANATTNVTVGALSTSGYLENAGKVPSAATVSVSKPHKITADITFSSGKVLKLNGATVNGINANTTKGSQVTSSTTISN